MRQYNNACSSDSPVCIPMLLRPRAVYVHLIHQLCAASPIPRRSPPNCIHLCVCPPHTHLIVADDHAQLSHLVHHRCRPGKLGAVGVAAAPACTAMAGQTLSRVEGPALKLCAHRVQEEEEKKQVKRREKCAQVRCLF